MHQQPNTAPSTQPTALPTPKVAVTVPSGLGAATQRTLTMLPPQTLAITCAYAQQNEGMELKDFISLGTGIIGLFATAILGYLAVYRTPRIAANLANRSAEDDRQRRAASIATSLLFDIARIHIVLREYLQHPTAHQLEVFKKTTISYLYALPELTLFSAKTVHHLLDVRRMYGLLNSYANDWGKSAQPHQLQIAASVVDRVLRVLPNTVAALEEEGGHRPPPDNFELLEIRDSYPLPSSAFPELDRDTSATLLASVKQPINGTVVTPPPAT